MIHYERFRPDMLQAAQKKISLIFLPLGPLEWHGPHLPIGTDGLIAQAVAGELAEQLNGTLLPPLFAGCAAPLSAETRGALGLPQGSEHSIGMDFAPSGFPSVYLREQTLESLLLDYVNALAAEGYRQIVIINGHGGNASVLNRICAKPYQGVSIFWYPSLLPLFKEDPNSGHATRMETAVMMALMPKAVNLSMLPPEGKKISCAQYGIADDRFFTKSPPTDQTVFADPRTATPELGVRYLEHTVQTLKSQIQENINVGIDV